MMLKFFSDAYKETSILYDTLKVNNVEDLYKKWNSTSLRKKKRVCKRVIKSYLNTSIPFAKWTRMVLRATKISKIIDSIDADIKLAYALRTLKLTTETKPVNIDKLI